VILPGSGAAVLRPYQEKRRAGRETGGHREQKPKIGAEARRYESATREAGGATRSSYEQAYLVGREPVRRISTRRRALCCHSGPVPT
jgi:hypothetical protein